MHCQSASRLKEKDLIPATLHNLLVAGGHDRPHLPRQLALHLLQSAKKFLQCVPFL